MTDAGSTSRLRQRLWGATVLIAIAVIVLPFLLDGAGSESQFRRVEQLRQAPTVPEQELSTRSLGQQTSESAPESSPESEADLEPEPLPVSEPESELAPEPEVRNDPGQTTQPALTAWVVQAGAFVNEEDALAVRDQLRRAGFASFVRDRDANSDPFRVLVGPMIRKQRAEQARENVAALLNNDPIIMSYP